MGIGAWIGPQVALAQGIEHRELGTVGTAFDEDFSVAFRHVERRRVIIMSRAAACTRRAAPFAAQGPYDVLGGHVAVAVAARSPMGL